MVIKGNKGFSLVELVIVIAIMAVLTAVLVPLYIKYVEESKVTTDEEIASSVLKALQVAITDENIEERPLDGFSPDPQIRLEDIGVVTDKPYTDFVREIKNSLQTDDLSIIKSAFKSKSYKGQDILVEIKSGSQTVIVTVNNNDGDSSHALVMQ